MTAMDLETFNDQYGSVVTNALAVYTERMRDEAKELRAAYEATKDSPPAEPIRDGDTISHLPTPGGMFHMAKIFDEAADRAEKARRAYEDMTEGDDEEDEEDDWVNLPN